MCIVNDKYIPFTLERSILRKRLIVFWKRAPEPPLLAQPMKVRKLVDLGPADVDSRVDQVFTHEASHCGFSNSGKTA